MGGGAVCGINWLSRSDRPAADLTVSEIVY